MMTAAAALDRDGHADDADQGRRHAPPRQGPDQDRRRRPQGHGLDDVRGRRRLLAQRRRRQGRARARRRPPAKSSAILYDMWLRLGYRRADRHRRRRRGRRARPRPGDHDWREIDLANGAFGQGVAVTPIQLATAYAALVNGGTLVQPHVVKSIGERRRRAAPRAGVVEPALSPTLIRTDAARHHRGPVLPRPDARPGLRRRRQDGTAQIWDPSANEGAGRGSTTSSTTRSSATSAAQTGMPDLVVAIRIEEGTPDGRAGRPARDAGHVVRAVPADRDRRDHDAGPAAPSGRSSPRRRHRTGDRGLCDTGARDRRRSVAPGAGATDPASRPARPTTWSRLTGGRLLARSDRPILGAAVDSRLVDAGQLFVALPGERTDGHAFLADGDRAGERPRSSSPGRSADAGPRSATSPSSGSPTRWRRSGPSPPAGAAGSTRSWSASPGASPRRRPRRRSRRSSAGASGRCATRATRTTRSGCR